MNWYTDGLHAVGRKILLMISSHFDLSYCEDDSDFYWNKMTKGVTEERVSGVMPVEAS